MNPEIVDSQRERLGAYSLIQLQIISSGVLGSLLEVLQQLRRTPLIEPEELTEEVDGQLKRTFLLCKIVQDIRVLLAGALQVL